jgi:hypothetical protein
MSASATSCAARLSRGRCERTMRSTACGYGIVAFSYAEE